MADLKISALPAATLPLTGTEDVAIVQGGVTKRTDISTISSLPPGVIVPYGAISPPSGWLLADGSAVSRSTYAALFAVFGVDFGSGNGSTTFNVPDLRGRVAVALDNLGGVDAGRLQLAGSNTIGFAAGEDKHNLSASENGDHVHTISGHTGDTNLDLGSGSALLVPVKYPSTEGTISPLAGGTGMTFTWIRDHVIGHSGSSVAHNNLQPFMALAYIVKT